VIEGWHFHVFCCSYGKHLRVLRLREPVYETLGIWKRCVEIDSWPCCGRFSFHAAAVIVRLSLLCRPLRRAVLVLDSGVECFAICFPLLLAKSRVGTDETLPV